MEHRFSIKNISIIITILAMFASVCIWVGTTSAKVSGNTHDIEKQECRIEEVENATADTTLNQAVIINQLKNIEQMQLEINKKIDKLDNKIEAIK